MRSLRRLVACSASLLAVLALLAQTVGAGAVMADDLRDIFDQEAAPADNPATPGPDLFPARAFDTSIPVMPPLVAADLPEGRQAVYSTLPAAFDAPHEAPAPAMASPELGPFSGRGPPAFL